MLGIALVDYDNVCRMRAPEKNQKDVALNLEELLGALSLGALRVSPGLEELQVRLYGGWRDRLGRPTQRAGWLTGELPTFRSRINRLRVRPSLATTLLDLPGREIISTFRSEVVNEQKMVDGMLIVDALAVVRDEVRVLFIVSDDDDFVPAAIASVVVARPRTEVILLRRKKQAGAAPNDELVQSVNVRITTC